MSNYKPPDQRKRNHVNVYFSDQDMAKVRTVMDANPDMRLDNLIVFALLKIYGNHFDDDYNARYLQHLYRERERLLTEINDLSQTLGRKNDELKAIEDELKEVMYGAENDKIRESDGRTDCQTE